MGAAMASDVRVGAFRGTSGLPGFLRQPSGPGWTLVGDAGYTKDPVSAHGLSAALRDAELCARTVVVGLCIQVVSRNQGSVFDCDARTDFSSRHLFMERGGGITIDAGDQRIGQVGMRADCGSDEWRGVSHFVPASHERSETRGTSRSVSMFASTRLG